MCWCSVDEGQINLHCLIFTSVHFRSTQVRMIYSQNSSKNVRIQEMKNIGYIRIFMRYSSFLVVFVNSSVCRDESWRARAALCKNSIRRKTYIYRTLFMVSTMCASPRQRSDFRCRPFCFFRVWFLRFLRKLFLFLFYCLRQLPRQIEHNSSFFRPFSCADVVVVQREFNSIVFGTSSNLQQTWGSMCAATTAAAIRGEYEFVISYKTMEKLERKKLFTHAHRRHLLHAK